MKNVKKVLALMLAITMMFGVVSICASAADTTTASFKITYKDANGEVIDSAKAGDTIDVFIAIKTDGYAPNFYIQSFYDVTLLTQVSTSSAAFDKNTAYEAQGRFTQTGVVDAANGGNGEALDWGAGTFNSALHNKRMYPKSWTDAEKAQYQGFAVGWKAPASAGSIVTVNTQNQFEDFAKLRFTVIADTALNDSTFKLEKSMTYVNIDPDDVAVNLEQTSSPVKVTGDSLNIEYASAGGSGSGSTTTPVLEMSDPKVQWKDPSNPEVLRVRFETKLTGITPTVGDDGFVNNIDRIGFKFSRTDAELANFTQVDSSIIYNFDDGSYKFCAITEVTMSADIINGTTASPLYASAVITVNGVETPTSVYSTTIAEEYNEGVGLNLTPFPAA